MLSNELKNEIQVAYRNFLNNKSLNPRYGQRLMIAAIANTLGNIDPLSDAYATNEAVCVVEAGTGTGKTVAYLIATIPIARALNKRIVIATATVALQEQIVFKDLPDLKEHSGLEFSFTLAKGRSRYLCLQKLDHLIASEDGQTIPLYEGLEQVPTKDDKKIFSDMLSQLSRGEWSGDKDSWTEPLEDETWSKVTTDHRQCSGRRCEFIRQCAFFKAREQLNQVDCVVANQDLVLADLALGGGAILPSPQDTIYIFDEAHHLPEKALSHFSSRTRIVSTLRWTTQIETQLPKLNENLIDVVGDSWDDKPLLKTIADVRQSLETIQPQLAPFIGQAEAQISFSRYRFAKGEANEPIEKIAASLSQKFQLVVSHLQKRVDLLELLLDEDQLPVSHDELESAYRTIGSWLSRAEASIPLWQSFSSTQYNAIFPIARWLNIIELEEGVEFELVSSPILASKTLDEKLWCESFAAVATSATITALGNFDRFKLRAGTPEGAHYSVVPSPFDCQNKAVFYVPEASVEANNVQDHTASIIDLLPKVIGNSDNALVLFSSRRQMDEVYVDIEEDFRTKILMQGSQNKQALIQLHKQNCDDGKQSIIFGLASFAEGLDLPGHYCRHVVIAKIPFAVPDDPVEAAMAEWIEEQGRNSFMEISVPDAAIKLVQACGRLLRTESDEGQITLLDRRIVTKRYGKALLASLPPYKQVIE